MENKIHHLSQDVETAWLNMNQNTFMRLNSTETKRMKERTEKGIPDKVLKRLSPKFRTVVTYFIAVHAYINTPLE